MALRIGVLSTARIAVRKVIPAMQAAQACTVTAIASRELARARAVAEHLGIPHAFGAYDALLASDEVDAVYIALPNHLHAEWTAAAAAAGKHVLCEKPLGLTAAQAQEMIGACRSGGVQLMGAYMYRFHPQWARVRELVAEGALGDVQAVQTVFAYDNRDPADIRNIPAFGGGALLDIGCYAVDSARLVLGSEPVEAAGVVRIDPEFGTDVLTTAVLEFPGGRHAAFTCGTQTARAQWVRVLGSAGGLLVETPFVGTPDEPVRLVRFGPGQDDRAEIETLAAANHYTLMADAFARAVLAGEGMPLPPDDGVATLQVLDTLRERWVT